MAEHPVEPEMHGGLVLYVPGQLRSSCRISFPSFQIATSTVDPVTEVTVGLRQVGDHESGIGIEHDLSRPLIPSVLWQTLAFVDHPPFLRKRTNEAVLDFRRLLKWRISGAVQVGYSPPATSSHRSHPATRVSPPRRIPGHWRVHRSCGPPPGRPRSASPARPADPRQNAPGRPGAFSGSTRRDSRGHSDRSKNILKVNPYPVPDVV